MIATERKLERLNAICLRSFNHGDAVRSLVRRLTIKTLAGI